MSATKKLFEEAQAFYAADRLMRHPEALDEAIALHYAAAAATAMQMKKLVEMRRFSRDYNCEQCIAYFREQIRTAHLTAFGLPPNWPERPAAPEGGGTS